MNRAGAVLLVVLAGGLAAGCGDETAPALDSGGAVDAAAGDAAGPGEIVLVQTVFVVPSGTRVLEFDFDATGTVPAFDTDGASLTVAVLDLSHPDRDQASICPMSHPLDGCPTVDYGAFGTTHDNRFSVEGAAGELMFHLYEDRGIQPAAEPLAPDE